MTNIRVRQAVPSDLAALSELFDEYRQFYGQPSDLGAAREFLSARTKRGESTLFIAQVNERAVGFAQLYPSFSSVSMRRTFILNDLYVRPAARRKGAAKRLLESAEAFARSVGAIRLTLSTARTNEHAQALYITTGWKQDDEFHVFHRAIHA